jgi:hypothetical protein
MVLVGKFYSALSYVAHTESTQSETPCWLSQSTQSETQCRLSQCGVRLHAVRVNAEFLDIELIFRNLRDIWEYTSTSNILEFIGLCEGEGAGRGGEGVWYGEKVRNYKRCAGRGMCVYVCVPLFSEFAAKPTKPPQPSPPLPPPSPYPSPVLPPLPTPPRSSPLSLPLPGPPSSFRSSAWKCFRFSGHFSTWVGEGEKK